MDPSYKDIQSHPFLCNQVVPELGVQAFCSSLDICRMFLGSPICPHETSVTLQCQLLILVIAAHLNLDDMNTLSLLCMSTARTWLLVQGQCCGLLEKHLNWALCAGVLSGNKQFSVHLFWIWIKPEWVWVQVQVHNRRWFHLLSLHYKLWRIKGGNNFSLPGILLPFLLSKGFLKANAWRNK